jgi:hypothetical protein
LVQFENVEMTAMPRMFLASPPEIAKRLHETANGRGDSILYENYTFGARAFAAGTTERLPEDWAFSEARVASFLNATQLD